MSKQEAWQALREIGRELDRQTLRTIRGQLRAGDVDGAMRGIERIKEKNRGRLSEVSDRAIGAIKKQV